MPAMDAAAPRSASVVEPEELVPPSPAGPPSGDQPPDGRTGDGADGRRSASAASTGVPPSEDREGPPFGHTTVVLITIGMVVALAASLVMRFWTKSDLWLDEALTVNIARLPLREIPSFLRRDGAPPLYYVLLHFWIGWFGTSDEAVRALSGVIGVITLPFAYLAGKRLGGRTAGWAALCWWPPRRSPSATTPRPGCTRWSCSSPCSGSWPSIARSAIPGPAI